MHYTDVLDSEKEVEKLSSFSGDFFKFCVTTSSPTVSLSTNMPTAKPASTNSTEVTALQVRKSSLLRKSKAPFDPSVAVEDSPPKVVRNMISWFRIRMNK